MAITSGFFNSVGGDRTYNAAQIGKYLQYIVSSGVFPYVSTSLQVLANDGMDVEVQAGRAMLDHHYMENDAPITLTLAAGGTQDRIDAIIMYVDMSERACGITVKAGTPAAAPVAPAMTRTDVRKEYMLAKVHVTKLSTAITQSSITDTRADTTVCGWVTGLVKQVDTSTLFLQWQTAYEEEFAKTQDYLAAQQAAWETFFNSVTQDNVLPAPALTQAGHVLAVNDAANGYELKPVNAAHFNYLDNSDFTNPVNQRGQESYSAGGGYTIDRWVKRNTGLLTIVKNEGIQIASVGSFAGLFQTIENGTKRLAGKTVTMAAYVLKNPGKFEMLIGNSSNQTSAGVAYGEKVFDEPGLVVSSVTLPETFDGGDYLNFFIGEGDTGQTVGSVLEIAWCALYEGEYTAKTLPRYQSKGYANELLICRQYDALSGEYAGLKNFATPCNLLDNSDFTNPVNQRGETSYTGAVYTIDRWKGINGSLKVGLGTSSITISGHWLYQVFDSKKLKTGGVYTLAACESDGTLSILNFTQGTTASLSSKIAYEVVNGFDRVRLYVGTWKWAAVYEGTYTAETLPEYHPKGYAAEYAECVRYFERIDYGTVYKIVGAGYTTGTSSDVRITLHYAVKRAIPTVTLNFSTSAVIMNQEYLTPTEPSINGATKGNCVIKVTVGAGWAKTTVVMYANGYIDASADL